jgi:hypothetical protein
MNRIALAEHILMYGIVGIVMEVTKAILIIFFQIIMQHMTFNSRFWHLQVTTASKLEGKQ